MADIKNLTRTQWNLTGNPTTEQLQLSCMMRIADATEAMAKPFVNLLNEVRLYKETNERLRTENQRLRNKIAGHKAAFTKLKNKNASRFVNAQFAGRAAASRIAQSQLRSVFQWKKLF